MAGIGYPDEAAWASAHFSRGGAVSLPRPLRPSDAALARRIFLMQGRGNIPEAQRAVDQLEDPVLMGPILADRYLGRFHRSTVDELTDWLAKYGDCADAPAIFALLRTKLPKGAPVPSKPELGGLDRSAAPDPVPENQDEPHRTLARDPALDGRVMDQAGKGAFASALRLVASRPRLSPAYGAELRAEVAQAAFIANRDDEALRIADAVLRDTPENSRPTLAYYIAGLAAWRQDRMDLALTMFAGGANAAMTTPSLRAASAFWASRAARRLHDAAGTTQWLHVAADQPLTFHGFLARRMLRLPTGIVPSGQLVSQADADAVGATAPGRRAFALLQIGQTSRAEAELRLLWPQAQASATFARSLLLVASAAQLIDFAAQMADLLQAAEGVRYDELRFPVPQLRPAGGFHVDPALVYALTRLESNFDTTAVSPAGAHGLMQIMPATAESITGSDYFDLSWLHEPEVNLDIGQRYITVLARQDGVDEDLMRLLASYNAGPGALARWEADMRDGDDPLMFIETIPVAETRAFVPTALVYSWIYAARLHVPAPSLDQLAAGEFPRFTDDGRKRKMMAAAPVLH
ncbi:MAG TPA: lytic transglycosylase domain-containing protein [Rhodopila sp.]|uniref:lytic transglycosylase domain-containing protein n=1 Tax=Rhodopila sp. TaxID=2480087 RepID=UPI002CED59D5|nr:lytic transglycosylase domain-containing protein [Rhodopila sp.]HVY15526.1 lytic transglycosylase domain-containing protein [Rhodopila sp.]